MVDAFPAVTYAYRLRFQEKARSAGRWALDFVQSHSGCPEVIWRQRSSLFQALASVITYGDDTALAVRLAQALHEPSNTVGLWAEMEPLLRLALERARQASDHAAVGRLLMAQAQTYTSRGQWQYALAPLEEAMRLDLDDNACIHAHLMYAECQLYLGNAEQTRQVFLVARQKARQRGVLSGRLDIIGYEARLHQQRGEWRRALRKHRAALALCRQHKIESLVINNLNFLGLVCRELGDYPQARLYLNEVLDICRSRLFFSGVGTVLINLGHVSLTTNDLPEAQCYFTESLEVLRPLNNAWKTALALHGLGCVRLAAGEYPAAEAYFEEAAHTARLCMIPVIHARIHASLGDLRQAQGRLEESRACYQLAQQLYSQAGDIYHAGLVQEKLAICPPWANLASAPPASCGC